MCSWHETRFTINYNNSFLSLPTMMKSLNKAGEYRRRGEERAEAQTDEREGESKVECREEERKAI